MEAIRRFVGGTAGEASEIVNHPPLAATLTPSPISS